MTKKMLISIIISLLSATYISIGFCGELLVVVNPDNPSSQLTRNQVIDIFMGRHVNYPDGTIALPLDQAPDSPVRQQFYRVLIDKSVAQVNAYWARLLFTGRSTPPHVVISLEDLKNTVSKNRGSIAYIESKDLSSNLKVVHRMGDGH